MINTEKSVKCLNDLLQLGNDAEQGFMKAAEKTDNNSLRRFFNSKANQRKSFQNDLRSQIIKLGGDPEIDGTMRGSIHRFWMDVVSTFTGKDAEEILDICEDGEENALEKYDDVLKKDFLPADVRYLVREQRNSIAATKRRIDVLEKQFDS